ncbi:MAG: hypothetical protein AAF726_18935 [Planctomycetota bacterium]
MITLLLALAPALPVVQASPSTADVERLSAWPECADAPAVKRAVARLRKAHNPEMEAGGHADVEAAGACAAPILLKWLGKERDEATQERLTTALDAVTSPAHTRLLAEHFDDRVEAVQRFAVRRVAVLGDPGLREVAEARYDALAERAADPKKGSEVDPLDLDLAAVLCTSTGSQTGLDRVLALAQPEPWTEWKDTLSPAATHASASGTDVRDAVVRELASAREAGAKGRQQHVAALTLLARVGGSEDASTVAPSLDDEANQVLVAAINALRMLVDGDPPLEKISTFDAIERAGKWKARL